MIWMTSQKIHNPIFIFDEILIFAKTVNAPVLTNNGASVETANNGLEALNKALHGDFNIVLMDIQMP